MKKELTHSTTISAKIVLLFFAAIAMFFASFSEGAAQTVTYDTKGTDFWLTFIPNFHNNYNSPTPRLRYGDSLYIFITAEEATSGVIDYRDYQGGEYSTSFTISDPSEIYTFKVSWWDFELKGYNEHGQRWEQNQCETVASQSFRVQTDAEVTVYAHSQAVTTSDAFLVLPTDVLGSEYLVMAYNSDGQGIDEQGTPSEFAIVATENDTKIDIVPAGETYVNSSNPQQIELDQGEVYLVQAAITLQSETTDLTGSEVKADKPIAVFAGHQRSTVPINVFSYSSRDVLIEEMLPVHTWGKNAFIVPFVQPNNIVHDEKDIFRVLAAYDNTEVKIGGVPEPLINRGEFIEKPIDGPTSISASAPVLVAEYKTTANSTASLDAVSDPFMTLIPPKEQFMKKYRVINTQAWEYEPISGDNQEVYTEQYIGLVVPNSAINSVELDGTPVDPMQFKPIPQTNYSYANISVSDGKHDLEADEEFGVYIYGYGYANSYGYIGGMMLEEIQYDPIEIAQTDDCFRVVVDATAPEINKIASISIVDEESVNVTIEAPEIPELTTSLSFSAELLDKNNDGKFKIIATDSIGGETVKEILVKGKTVGFYVSGARSDTILHDITMDYGDEVCAEFELRNFGFIPKNITNAFFSNPVGKKVTSAIPLELGADESTTIEACVTGSAPGEHSDTLVVESECGESYIILNYTVRETGDCDDTEFSYDDFSSPGKLKMHGDVWLLEDFLRLTRSYNFKTGVIYRNEKVPVAKGFTTIFSFRFSDPEAGYSHDGSHPGADGIAFLIQNISLFEKGGPGGSLAYDGIRNSLAVEIDVFKNDKNQLLDYADPNGNHIAVQSLGTEKNTARHGAATLGIAEDIPEIRSDSTVYWVKIDYRIVEDQLRVFIDETGDFATPALVVPEVKLDELLNLFLGEGAYVGICAATGDSWQAQDLLSWSMCPKPSEKINSVEQVEDFSSDRSGFACYPNPASGSAKFEFGVEKTCEVSLDVYDMLGSKVAHVFSGELFPGSYVSNFDSGGLPNGTYLCALNRGGKIEFIKLIVYK